MAGPLYIFLDESGNLDFSSNGTKYWSLTALCTFDPVLGRSSFAKHRYDLAAAGGGIEYFHASENKQHVRDRMFEDITGLEDGSEVHVVLAEKRKAHPSLYQRQRVVKGKNTTVKDPTSFYHLVCRTLLKYIIKRKIYQDAECFVIILSSLFTNEKQSVLDGALKSALKEFTKQPFHIYFPHNKADINCQIADYCGWAITIAWERKEMRPLKIVSAKVKSQFDLFSRGRTTFY